MGLLQKVEHGENILFDMGFTDFRIRIRGDIGLIQMPPSQFQRAAELHDEIQTRLNPSVPHCGVGSESKKVRKSHGG